MANYEKTAWKAGDLITEEKLNKIENKLADVGSGVVSAVRYDIPQELNEDEKRMALENIGFPRSTEEDAADKFLRGDGQWVKVYAVVM